MCGFIVFLKSGYAVAQNVQIDSLKALLESTTDDSMRAEIILEIGSAYEQIDPYQSIAYAKQALDIFSILENDFGRGKALNMVGHYNWLMGVFKESIAYYKEALDLFYKLDKPDWIARVANNLGAVYWGLGDYNAALELYRESLALQTELGNLSNVALINNNIGLIYQKWQLYDEAMKYHRDALALAEEIEYLFAKAYSNHNLGLCYEALGDYEQALAYYEKSYKDYLKDVGKGSATSLVLRNIGDIYYKTGDFDKAIRYYRWALADGEKIKNLFRTTYAQHSLGKAYAQAGHLDSARFYIMESLNASRKMGYSDVICNNYYVLSSLEETEGNLANALEYYKMATTIHDSIFNKEKLAKFTDLQIHYNIEKKEQENELLRQKNEIQQLQIHHERIIRISLIIGLVFILSILFLIAYQSRKLSKANIVLEAQNKEIMKMNSEKEDLIYQLEKENKERRVAEKRIAALLDEKELLLKEVHHRIKNNMNTMKSLLFFQAKTVKDPQAVEVLKDAGSRIQSMSVLYNKIYRSDNLKAMSTQDYIPNLVEDLITVFFNRDNIHIEMDIEKVILPVTILSSLGIITTELVTNAMKYGFNENERGFLYLGLHRANTMIEFEIRNSGEKLPEDFSMETSQGFGLHLVKMLVQQLGGKIRIESNHETRFVITFPLSLG